MVRIIRIGFIAFVVFLLTSCSKSTSSSDTDRDGIPLGGYKYTAYDTTGTKVVEGLFTLDFQDSTSFEGEWHTEIVGSPEYPGPQVGDGNLKGGLGRRTEPG